MQITLIVGAAVAFGIALLHHQHAALSVLRTLPRTLL
jgi:hypothetical protein